MGKINVKYYDYYNQMTEYSFTSETPSGDLTVDELVALGATKPTVPTRIDSKSFINWFIDYVKFDKIGNEYTYYVYVKYIPDNVLVDYYEDVIDDIEDNMNSLKVDIVEYETATNKAIAQFTKQATIQLPKEIADLRREINLVVEVDDANIEKANSFDWSAIQDEINDLSGMPQYLNSKLSTFDNTFQQEIGDTQLEYEALNVKIQNMINRKNQLPKFYFTNINDFSYMNKKPNTIYFVH